MGQDIVARDKVELHSSCVVLEGQEALPHNGVLLFKGKQTGSELMTGHGPRQQAYCAKSSGDLRTF